MEYTKGKWEAELKLYPYSIWSKQKNGREIPIADVHKQPKDEELANAQLIAAAPDLYEALKGLAIAYNVDAESVIVNQDPEYWQRALKAITKVKK